MSLIATFAVLYGLGYSANTITLFALVLAIGLVVDDAIINRRERPENDAREPGDGAARSDQASHAADHRRGHRLHARAGGRVSAKIELCLSQVRFGGAAVCYRGLVGGLRLLQRRFCEGSCASQLLNALQCTLGIALGCLSPRQRGLCTGYGRLIGGRLDITFMDELTFLERPFLNEAGDACTDMDRVDGFDSVTNSVSGAISRTSTSETPTTG